MIAVMARWEPGARERLETAAFQLFHERGFEQTTVTDIAARAGLDKRTFYRLFGDKREALFSGGKRMEQLVAEALDNAPDASFDSVAAAFRHVADEIFADRLELARDRQAIIESSPDLMERELLKRGSLARTVAEALRRKGLEETPAALAAESGGTVFHLAFVRWIAPGNTTSLADLITEVADELRRAVN